MIRNWVTTRVEIRTSGEVRLLGFMLWQSAYSAYYFCDAYWPAPFGSSTFCGPFEVTNKASVGLVVGGRIHAGKLREKSEIFP
jgi:Undecaprenyl pyrophosphate synthase